MIRYMLPKTARRIHCRSYTTSTPTINRLSGALGAEITGIDLTKLTPSHIPSIRQALLNHQVIFFRDQNLSAQQFLDFTEHFGTSMNYPFVSGIEGYPTIINVLKREHEITNFGGVWHSDTTYFAQPPMGSVLYALEVPPVGGDTLFANQHLAYERLSEGLKRTLSQLKAVSSSSKAIASKTREDRVKDSGKQTDVLEAVHPVVRTHPETGRKSLYINVAHTTKFEGWTEDESRPLLEYLHAWQILPEFQCRFRWEKGSISFWDNRVVLHNPVNDYHGYRRSMWRITLKGDTPV